MKNLMLLLTIILIPNTSQAFSKIEGHNIILITAREVQDLDKPEEEVLINRRAEAVCQLLNKRLKSFTFEKNSFSDGVIVQNGYFRKANPEDIETHLHDGGIWVAGLTLGLIPIIITYETLVVKDIQCSKGEASYKVGD